MMHQNIRIQNIRIATRIRGLGITQMVLLYDIDLQMDYVPEVKNVRPDAVSRGAWPLPQRLRAATLSTSHSPSASASNCSSPVMNSR